MTPATSLAGQPHETQTDQTNGPLAEVIHLHPPISDPEQENSSLEIDTDPSCGITSTVLLRGIGASCLERTVFGEGRERRIDLLEVNKNRIPTLVSEPHPDMAPDPDKVPVIALIVGWLEDPTTQSSSAYWYHDAVARWNPGHRVVSFANPDIIQAEPFPPLWKAIPHALFRSFERTATDYLGAVGHYATEAEIILNALSGGVPTAIQMAKQNLSANHQHRLPIARELQLVGPCLVARKVPEAERFRPEGDMHTRFNRLLRFAGHLPEDYKRMRAQSPEYNLSLRDFAESVRPGMIPAFIGDFMRLLQGTRWEDIKAVVAEHHTIRVLTGELDPLNEEPQFAALEKLFPGSVRYEKVPDAGHCTVISAWEKIAEALFPYHLEQLHGEDHQPLYSADLLQQVQAA